MEIFNGNQNLRGRNLYVDLDVMITQDCSDMWTLGGDQFVICQDFNRTFIPNYKGLNSSVMAWTDNSMHYLYELFQSGRAEQMGLHRGDQDFIQKNVKTYDVWPREWAMSYRWEIWRGGHKDGQSNQYHSDKQSSIIPAACKMVVFHGRPKPHEITEKSLARHWTSP